MESADTFAAGLSVPSQDPEDIEDAGTWVNESFSLAKSSVYIPPVGDGDGLFSGNARLHGAGNSASQEQVALAAARLAAVLDADFKPVE